MIHRSESDMFSRWCNFRLGCRLAAWAGVVALLVGCGGAGPVQMNARVMLDGQPLERAAVTFVSVGSHSRRPATGMTEADGTFQLTTYKQGDGVMPGSYKVCVSKTEPTVGKNKTVSTNVGSETASFDDYFSEASKVHPQQKSAAKQIVPDIYRDPDRTPLECTVPNDGSEIVFALSSDPQDEAAR